MIILFTSPKISAGLSLLSLVYHLVLPQYAWAGLAQIDQEKTPFLLASSQNLSFLAGRAVIQYSPPRIPKVVFSRWVMVTAYSSTPDQTDATPFITASGTYVRDGVAACNFLRFGTQLKIPQLFGEKVFVVEDRMAKKNSHKIDIWFPSRAEAKQFGVKRLKVEILES